LLTSDGLTCWYQACFLSSASLSYTSIHVVIVVVVVVVLVVVSGSSHRADVISIKLDSEPAFSSPRLRLVFLEAKAKPRLLSTKSKQSKMTISDCTTKASKIIFKRQ